MARDAQLLDSLLAKWEGTPAWQRLERGLAMDFDTPDRIHIRRFCNVAGITPLLYDAMMERRAEVKATKQYDEEREREMDRDFEPLTDNGW